jgi:glycerophosphoryl diester phosphodiesterase
LELWIAHKLGLRTLFRKFCSQIDALQIPTKFGPLRFDNAEFIQAVSAQDVEVHFWTINDFQEAQRLRTLGAKGIVTDQSKMMFERFTAEGIEII